MASEKPKVEQVANLKQSTGVGKFFSRFFNTDLKSIANDALTDVIMPSVKNLGLYAVESFFDGKEGSANRIGTKSSLSTSKNNQTNYTSKFHYKSSGGNNTTDYTEASKPKYNEIVVETREDALKVLESMDNLVREYGEATRDQLYSLIGVTGDFQDAKWGWNRSNWDRPSFKRVGGGYLLIFPSITHLED